ncbi:MAG: hypothetical protein ABI639_17245 [Thermoanaerobaculia bacterium]
MIRDSKLRLEQTCPRTGRPALFPFEAGRATADLNFCYLNFRGGIDNLAWAIKHRHGLLPNLSEDESKGRPQVDLFGPQFLRELAGVAPGLCDGLNSFENWYGELRNLRDPSAHRIPLYVPPGLIIDAEFVEELRDLEVSRVTDGPGPGVSLSEWSARAREGSRFAPVFMASAPAGHSVYSLYGQLDHDHRQFLSVAQVVLGSLDPATH